jgi:hypothetical protein
MASLRAGHDGVPIVTLTGAAPSARSERRAATTVIVG